MLIELARHRQGIVLVQNILPFIFILKGKFYGSVFPLCLKFNKHCNTKINIQNEELSLQIKKADRQTAPECIPSPVQPFPALWPSSPWRCAFYSHPVQAEADLGAGTKVVLRHHLCRPWHSQLYSELYLWPFIRRRRPKTNSSTLRYSELKAVGMVDLGWG